MKIPEEHTYCVGLEVSEMLVVGENKNREYVHNYLCFTTLKNYLDL